MLDLWEFGRMRKGFARIEALCQFGFQQLARDRVLLLLIAMGLAVAQAQTVVTTVGGTDWLLPTDALQGLSAPLGRVASLAIDSAGNTYIADESNNLVLKLRTDGVLSVFAGNGFSGFSGDGGPSSQASLKAPRGVAVGPNDEVYIADSGNLRIRKVSANGIIMTFAGSGLPGRSGDGGPATAAGINPIEVAADRLGNVYIVDTNTNCVRRVDTHGVISTFAGTTVAGFSGDGGLATEAQLDHPIAVAIDSNGVVYIADWQNWRVRRVTTDGKIGTFAGNGDKAPPAFIDNVTATSATVGAPRQLSIDSQGSVYITDQGFNRIRKVTAGVISTVAGNGITGLTGDNGPATQATLGQPSGMVVAGGGVIFIADTENFRIRQVSSSGVIRTIAGNGGFRQSPSDGQPAALGVLSAPEGVAVGPDGAIYFSNTAGHRILKIKDGLVYTVAGSGIRTGGTDGGPASEVGLYFPSGIAFDSKGNLYIADHHNFLVRKITPDGRSFNFAGGGSSLQDGAAATAARLEFPADVAVDRQDNVYIAEEYGQRIRKVTTDGKIITVAGNGTFGFAPDGTKAVLSGLGYPRGVAVDAAGNVYIADSANNRVRMVTPDGLISTVVGTGGVTPLGDGGSAKNATLGYPSGVRLDSSGNLYIADTGHCLIRLVSGGIISTVAGNGQQGFSGDGGSPSNAAFNAPNGLAIGSNGTIYIADTLNNRIRALSGERPSVTSSADAISLAARSGGASTGQTISLAASVAGTPFQVTILTADGSGWLKVSSASGQLPANLEISANPATLNPGTYQGVLTVSTPNADPAVRKIAVTLTVDQADAAILDYQPGAISFSLPQDSPAAGKVVFVSNRGTGTLRFNAQPAANAPAAWLNVSVSSDVATAGSAGSITVTADPKGLAAGNYATSLIVASTTGTQSLAVPINLTVTPENKPRMLVSQAGLTFRAPAGYGDLPQCFAVLNIGQGSLTFTASVTSGSNWLTVTTKPCPYRVVSSVNPISIQEVVAEINTSKLSPGDYDGEVLISGNADNAPQTVKVKLTILDSNTPVGLVVRPSGLVFTSVAGGATPGSLDVTVFNPSTKSFAYSSNSFSLDGGRWIEYLPATGTVGAFPSPPAVVRAQPAAFGALPANNYNGFITIGTATYGARTVDVLLSLSPSGGNPSGAVKNQLAAAGGCVPKSLSLVFTQVSVDFIATPGSPFPLEVYATDDCGAPLTSGSVVAVFDNGDRALDLIPLRDGRWAGTWNPGTSAGARVTLKVTAQQAGSTVRGELVRSGTLQPGSGGGNPTITRPIRRGNRVPAK